MRHSAQLAGLLVWVAAAGGVAASAPAQEASLRDLVRQHPQNREAVGKIAAKLGVEAVESIVAVEHTLLLKTGDTEKAVDPHTYKFAVGDEVRVRIEGLSTLHLYVFHVGPSGEEVCLLPQPVAGQDQPPLKQNSAIYLPAEGYFEFSAPPGSENLVVVASAKPLPDVAGMAGQLRPPPQLKAVWQRFQFKLQHRYEKVSYRGPLSDEALRKLGESKPRDLLLTEPPAGKATSTFAAAIGMQDTATLLINIPLNSEPRKKEDSRKPEAK